MAERVYKARNGLATKPVAAPAISTSAGAEISISAPLASIDGGQSAKRIYRKRSSVSTDSAQPQRTYTPRLSVKAEQAQGVWDWLEEANEVIQSTIEYTKVNEGKWVSGYASEYTDRVKALLQSAETIAPRIELYKEDEKAYSSLTTAYNEFKTYLDKFDNYATEVRAHYDQYTDEEAYNKAVGQSKTWHADAEGLENRVSQLESDIQFTEGLLALIEEYDYWMSFDPELYVDETGNGHGAAIVNGNRYELEKKMDYYGIPSDDFSARTKYKKELEEKLAAYKAEYDPSKDAQVINAVSAAAADVNYDQYVAEGKQKYQTRYDGSENILAVADSKTKENVEKMLSESENYADLWASLSQEQKDSYYYLLGKYGHEEANVYFRLARNKIKQDAAKAFYDEHLDGKWYQGLYSVVSGLDRFSTGMQNAFGNIYTDDRVLDPQTVKGEVYNALGEKETPIWYNVKKGEWENKILGHTAAQVGFDAVENAAHMLPAMVAGGAASLVNPAFGAAVQMSLTGLSAGGSSYKEAIDRGYEHYQAMNYGTMVGASEAVLEKVLSGTGTVVGGSVIGNALKEATGGIKNAALKFALKLGGSFASEAVEEGLQEVLVPFFENMALDADNTWSDIEWEQAGYAALLGGLTALGMQGVGGVANITANHTQQNAAYRQLGKQFLSGENGLTIDKAVEIGLNNAKGTAAYQSATKIQQKVKNGEKVSAYSVGRMVAGSQSEQAKISKGIENMVLTSAKEMGIETEAAETVAAAAVALGQKVEFVSPDQMHNRYMAGEYDGNTDTVRLNAAELDTGKLISAVLAHEMVHAAEGTRQLQVLEKTVVRMIGTERWNNLKAQTQQNYATRGVELDAAAVTRETLANWITQNLFTDRFAEAVAKGDANVGNAFFYLIDRARRALATQKENPSARDLAMLERLFMQAIDARTHTGKEGVQGALNESLGNQLQDWLEGGGKANGAYNGKYFDLGTTPDVFVKHGAKQARVIMYPDCLTKITGGKHSISLEEIAKLPAELNEPILLFNGSVENSFVALTELVDKQGHDVIAAIHINRKYNRLVVNKIASLYSKTDPQGKNRIVGYVNTQIEDGNLLDASTKKHRSGLRAEGSNCPSWFKPSSMLTPI